MTDKNKHKPTGLHPPRPALGEGEDGGAELVELLELHHEAINEIFGRLATVEKLVGKMVLSDVLQDDDVSLEEKLKLIELAGESGVLREKASDTLKKKHKESYN